MKRAFHFLVLVLSLLFVACTSVQEALTDDALSKARVLVTNWNCETGDSGPVDECYFDKGIILEDATFCEKITEFKKEECLAAMKDCKLLPTIAEKDQCNFDKMHARVNPALTLFQGEKYALEYVGAPCEKMNDEFNKGSCWSQVGFYFAEPALCDKAVASEKGFCYALILQRGYPSFDICDKMISTIGDPNENGYGCWLNVLFKKASCVAPNFPAQVYEQSTICIQKEGDSRVNPIETQAIALGDETICDSIPEKISREGCYAIVAIKKGSPEICKKIKAATPLTSVDFPSTCLNFVSLAKKNAGICELQGSLQDKEFCYYTYGTSHLDPVACRKSQNNECFTKVAIATQNFSVCKQANSADYCYYGSLTAPGKGKTPVLCEEIADDSLRIPCLRIVNEELAGE